MNICLLSFLLPPCVSAFVPGQYPPAVGVRTQPLQAVEAAVAAPKAAVAAKGKGKAKGKAKGGLRGGGIASVVKPLIGYPNPPKDGPVFIPDTGLAYKQEWRDQYNLKLKEEWEKANGRTWNPEIVVEEVAAPAKAAAKEAPAAPAPKQELVMKAEAPAAPAAPAAPGAPAAPAAAFQEMKWPEMLEKNYAPGSWEKVRLLNPAAVQSAGNVFV